MLKAEINQARVKIEFGGTPRETVTDVLMIITCIHKNIEQKCPKLYADFYKEMIKHAVAQPEMWEHAEYDLSPDVLSALSEIQAKREHLDEEHLDEEGEDE